MTPTESTQALQKVFPARQRLVCVSVFDAAPARHGYAGYDLLCYMAVLQLGISAIPLGIWGDWGILLVTDWDSITTASLPQWQQEKWSCRRNSSKSIILTRGNGSQHAIVVVGTGQGLDLEDLASGPMDIDVSRASAMTPILMALSTLWIVLLIVAAGLQQNTWFLIATGGLGMFENILVAGWPRQPKSLVFHSYLKRL